MKRTALFLLWIYILSVFAVPVSFAKQSSDYDDYKKDCGVSCGLDKCEDDELCIRNSAGLDQCSKNEICDGENNKVTGNVLGNKISGMVVTTYDCDDNCGSGVTNLCDDQECPEDKCVYEDKIVGGTCWCKGEQGSKKNSCPIPEERKGITADFCPMTNPDIDETYGETGNIQAEIKYGKVARSCLQNNKEGKGWVGVDCTPQKCCKAVGFNIYSIRYECASPVYENVDMDECKSPGRICCQVNSDYMIVHKNACTLSGGTTVDKSKCFEQALESGEDYQCNVVGFELEQETPSNALSWIRGAGDPRYIAYYEAFPQGEESAWLIPGDELVYTYIAIGAVFGVFGAAGKFIGGVTKSVTSAMKGEVKKAYTVILRKGAMQASKELAESGTKSTVKQIGIRSALKSAVFGDAVLENKIRTKAYSGVMDDVLEIHEMAGMKPKSGLLLEINNLWESAMTKADKKTALENLLEVEHKLSGDLAKTYSERIAKNMNLLADNGLNLALMKTTLKENTKRQIGAGFARLDSLPYAMKDKVATQTYDVAVSMWNNPAIKMQMLEMYDFADEEWADQGEVCTLACESLNEEGDYDDCDSQCNDGYNSIKDRAVKSGIGSGKNLYAFLGLFAIQYMIDFSESVNNKFEPVTVNSLGLDAPFSKVSPFEFKPKTNKYYVELVRDEAIIIGQEPTRFFLASPCKADIRVFKEQRRCAMLGFTNEEVDTVNIDDAIQFEEYKELVFEYCTDPAYENDLSGCNLVEMLYVDSNIFGENEVFYEHRGKYIPENAKAIKMCAPKTFWQGLKGISPWDETEHPEIPAIRIDLDMDSSIDKNFCYEGAHVWQLAAEGLIIVVETGVSILAAGPTLGASFVVAGAAGGLATAWVERTKFWPNH